MKKGSIPFNTKLSFEKKELLNRLYRSVWIRLGIITLLAGAAFISYRYRIILDIAPWLSPLFILIIALYVFSFIELLAIKRRKNSVAIAYISVSFDVLFVSVLVSFTGGLDSIYTFFYLFVAIEGGFLLSKKGALIFSSASFILYGLIVDAQFYKFIPSLIPPFQNAYPAKDILVNLITYISITFIVGILSAFLADSLLKAKKDLVASSTDLKKLSNLHSIIINSMDSGLITLDEHYTINAMNPAATGITGYNLDEIAEKKIDTIMSGIQLSGVSIKRHELQIKKKNNIKIQIGYNISNLHNDTGKLVGMVVTFQDLSEMKKMEAKLKRADILSTAGKLAASVAHEIRNPLASISGAVQLLMEDLKSNTESEKPLSLIYREVNRINNLVTEFLAMSKPVTYIQNNVQLQPIINEVFETVSKRVDYNVSVKLISNVADNLSIKADNFKIKQVLLNLVLNAIHATKEAGIVSIDCIKKDNSVIISVKDTGEGMNDNEIKLSLEPFWTTNPGGTGLGLPVVQSIIEQHNGVLYIKSKKGEGTVVTIKLPL